MIDTESTEALTRAIATSNKPRLLFISHSWGGGIERHIGDLIKLVNRSADVLVLRGFLNGGIECEWHTAGQSPTQVRVGGFSEASLDEWIRALADLSFERIHLHHVHGWPHEIIRMVEQLNRPLDVTLHDYASICPQYHLADEHGRYCGEPDSNGCRACIAKRPHAWNLQIEDWRATMRKLLARADRVIAPSQDVAQRLRRHYPEIATNVWPHPEPAVELPRLTKIVLLGGLSSVKGLAVVREVVTYAKTHAPSLDFVLIGHAAEALPKGLRATGSYDDRELPRLLASERPDAVWFPAQVPETFSYTLSVALAAGVSIVASDLGSFRERLSGKSAHRLVAHDATSAQWVDALANGVSTNASKSSHHASECEANYASRYLEALRDATSVAIDVVPFAAVLTHAEAPRDSGTYAAIDIFRVGRYGGHRASLDVIERELERLEPGETGFVGSEIYLRTAREFDDLRLRFQNLNLDAQEMRVALHSARQHFASAAATLEQREIDIENLQRQARNDARHVEHLNREFQRVTQSRSWKMTRPLRGASTVLRASPQILRSVGRAMTNPSRLAYGMELLREKGFAGTVRHFANKSPRETQTLAVDVAPPRIEALRLRTSNEPVLSIVIPVYEQHETTFGCLRSIAEFRPAIPFEVIVMDDTSPTPAAKALAAVEGVRFVRNEQNLGFLGNVNRGAQEARGEYLLILNNDTLLAAGAIDAMVATFGEHKDVGLVGAKLLNADGTLQEAGGIVWRDGSAWNWGRGEHPHDPQFNFVRDADYCSGAALVIKRKLFIEMNGFDTHFAPAYYEDTDLAFRIRARGLRVLYQPHAEVYHLEGVTHGRDQSSGIKAYQVTNAKKFYERWQTTLAAHGVNGERPAQEAHRATKLNILIVEAFLITPDQDSGSLRLLNLMRLLREEGHHITFIAENLEGTERYRRMIEAIGVELLHGEWARGVQNVLRTRARDYAVIMFCRHYVAAAHLETARLYAPTATILFDTVDLHFLRKEREAELLGDEAVKLDARKTRDEELSLCRQADATIVVSEVEKKLLSELLPDARVEILSNVHRIETERAPFEARSGALFVGGFRHPPNIDAVKWYATEVLPRVRELAPELVTRIVGSNMPEEIFSLAQPGLEILGFVEDIRPILRSTRVSIAPLRYGAGVKGKVNEAMNFGIPVVATPLAIEGMHMTHDVDCLVADEPAAFAAHIVALHTDAALWQRISGNAFAAIEAHFSIERAREAVRRVFPYPPSK